MFWRQVSAFKFAGFKKKEFKILKQIATISVKVSSMQNNFCRVIRNKLQTSAMFSMQFEKW